MLGNKRIAQVSLLVVTILSVTLLTGCWDRLEIEERAVVLGIGIDSAGAGAAEKEEKVSHKEGNHPDPQAGMIHVTVQIAVPGRIPLGPGQGGGGGGGGGGGQQSVWVVDVVGHTMQDALNNLQQKIAAPLFFGHLRIIVVSEDVARRGIENLNDYFRRNPEVRRMNWMFISKDKAIDLMQASPQLERVPTLYLLTSMDQAVKMGRFPNDFLGLFWSAMSAKGREGFLPYVELQKDDTVNIKGLALFRGEKMVGVTQPREIPLYMGIKGLSPAGGMVFVKVPGTENDFVMFGGTSRKAVVDVEIKNGRPRAKVKIFVEGNLLEKSNIRFKLDTDTVLQIQRQLTEQTTKNYKELIQKTQKESSDIFGFGEYFRAKESKYWNKHIKTNNKWEEIYKELPVEVTVNMNVRRVGMSAE